MKLIFAGSGSAFTVGNDNFQSNILLENSNGERLLIDCGTDIRWSLYDLGLTYKEINAVFISHLHTDHTGGLEWLAFSTYFDAELAKKPVLFLAQDFKNSLWEHVLCGGLNSIEGVQANLSTFFTLKSIKENNAFTWSGIRFHLIKTLHVKSKRKINPSFGLFFKVGRTKVFITGDTQFTPERLKEPYAQADLIFQDCETRPNPSGVHANFQNLTALDPEIKQKMWLYHINDGKLPNCKKEGFLGYVKKGQVFRLPTG